MVSIWARLTRWVRRLEGRPFLLVYVWCNDISGPDVCAFCNGTWMVIKIKVQMKSCCSCSTATYIFFLLCRPLGRNWARREAYLEMERRDKAGLPYISPDLLQPNRVHKCLPSDEELGDFQILIWFKYVRLGHQHLCIWLKCSNPLWCILCYYFPCNARPY